MLQQAQENLAGNLEDEKETIANLVVVVHKLEATMKPIIDKHLEAENMTMTQQAAFVNNLEDHENDLDELVATVDKLTQMTNVLFYLVCGLVALILMFFAVFVYTRCSKTPQRTY